MLHPAIWICRLDRNAQLQHDASIVSHIYQSGFQQGVRNPNPSWNISLNTRCTLAELRRCPIGETKIRILQNQLP